MFKQDEFWSVEEEHMRKYNALEQQRSYLLRVKETLWSQRSRACWLKDGDCNTIFFHGKEDQRRRKNAIKRLKDYVGDWKNSQQQCENILVEYF